MIRIIYTLSRLYKKLFIKRNRIMYIGGADTLPRPLTEKEESEIIARLDREESLRSVLIEHNLRLVVYISFLSER